MYHDWTIIEYFVQKGRIMDNKTFNSAYYMETKSPSYARTLLDCKRVAASNANVLLIGESGTGKDVAAQYIHALSRRSDKPFIAVNCNAYTESLLEPELFGVEPGDLFRHHPPPGGKIRAGRPRNSLPGCHR